MPSLRSRTSPLKFFASASSSTPKVEGRQDSQQAWQKEYLNNLRSNRPTRPSGSRPPPSHRPVSDAAASETPLRTSSAMSFRPTLPMRQTSPTRLSEQERCPSASSHRPEISQTLHSSSDLVDQGPSVDVLDLGAARGGPQAQMHPTAARIRDTSSTLRASSGTYREREQRLREKEEARLLREALQFVDEQEEARVHSVAQLEASELVWKHQNPQDLLQDANAPYLYKQHLRNSNHARSQSDVPVATSTRTNEDRGWIKRSASEYSSEAGSKKIISSIPVPAEENTVPQSSTRSEERNGPSEQTSHRLEDSKSQASQIHSLWDSPQKRAYTNLSFSLPQLRKAGRRRSSGAKARTPSGSLFSNPDDKIYEEPEGCLQDADPSKSTEEVAQRGPLKLTLHSPTPNLTSQSQLESMTDAVEVKERHSRTEIYRNPPSQSRDPSYLQNGLPPTPANPANDRVSEVTQPGTPDALEIRSDDIRAATSMRLKDRSPKLPSPTVVSNAKGRPIVSFDRNWTPSKADTKRQESLKRQTTNPDRDCQPRPTIRSKPAFPQSTASAPIIPTINVPEPPSIHIDESPPVPSISVSSLPTFSISRLSIHPYRIGLHLSVERPRNVQRVPCQSRAAWSVPPLNVSIRSASPASTALSNLSASPFILSLMLRAMTGSAAFELALTVRKCPKKWVKRGKTMATRACASIAI
ncbi:MAG: hypothetical protein L6R40_001213 [Gallowayella cf. fulva]|nr:MAG: hypothetical protein L6R40_001213 [Xanthomendoza cf. fulva]